MDDNNAKSALRNTGSTGDGDALGASVPKAPWPADHLPPFLTVPETAALLRTTVKAVYTLIERGLIPGVCRPRGWGRVLLKTVDVLSWLESSASSPGGSRR